MHVHRMRWARSLSLAASIALLASGFGGASVMADAASTQSRDLGKPTASHPQWLAQLTYTNGGPFGTTGMIGSPTGVPWTLADFQKLAKAGVTGVEINMDWQAMEPQPGVYDFSLVKQYAQECHQAGLTMIPIFWTSMWHPGNPPSWLQYTPEQANTGAVDNWPIAVHVGAGPAPSGLIPAFWSHRVRSAYQAFIVHAFQSLSSVPGFGGAYVDYGWLDAVYGPSPNGIGIEGYAAPDVAKYHEWLQTTYGTVDHLNQALGTSYASFDQVPPFAPGQAHFSVYQRFRAWSYQAIMGQIYSAIRQVSQKPIYIYFGGSMGAAGQFMNLPDADFALARRYHAIINVDNSNHTGFAALFGYLSQSYHVPVIYEWTPTGSISYDQAILAQWMGHVALEGRYRGGADYFAYVGSGHQLSFYTSTFPEYLAWHSALAKVRGSQPQYSVGIMLGYDQVLHNDFGYGITGDLPQIGNYLRSARPAANVFSDLSVLNGAVSLSRFHTIIDWNGDLSAPNLNPTLVADLKAFEKSGGTIIPGPQSVNANALALLSQPDGQYTVQTVLGRQAVVSEAGVTPLPHLYFRTPVSVVSPTQPDVQIQVTYANNQSNGFYLNYDSSNTNGAYTNAYPAGTSAPAAVTNTGQYQTATFDLTNAAFTGMENGGADFRIVADKPGLAVSSVTVTAGGSSAAFTPAQLAMAAVPQSVVVTPNAPQVEAFLSAGHGKVWLVASNSGASAFSGTISIPSSILSQVLPGYEGEGAGATGTVVGKSLLGNWKLAGGATWNIDIGPGGLAILQIQPGN